MNIYESLLEILIQVFISEGLNQAPFIIGAILVRKERERLRQKLNGFISFLHGKHLKC